MKSRETFAPTGPFLATADEVPEPHRLQVRLWVNDVLKQDFNTSEGTTPQLTGKYAPPPR
jgi:2-keto-4-pentenoate hydratase/2-oxohepta-3-ene-1,7-dioic acid hydratase in catechol pathway